MRKLVLGLMLAAGFVPMAVAQGQAQAQGRAGFLPDFTDLYERNGPAVVSIDVTQKARQRRGMPELSEDDPFYEFFRRFGQVPPRRGPEREPEAQSVGSGFVIGSNGEVERREVQLGGPRDRDPVLVAAGLSPGDRVVRSSDKPLSPGQKIADK